MLSYTLARTESHTMALLLLQWLKENPKPSLVLLSFVLAIVLRSLLKGQSRRKKLNLPPKPPGLPIIGNLHQLGNMPHLSLHKMAKKYGPIIFLKLGEIPTVVVSTAKLAKDVLKTHDLALSSRPQLFGAKYLFYDCTDIVFSPYGPYWRHIRKISILELLSVKRVQSYSFVREQEVARMIQRIADAYPGPANLTKSISLYSNAVMCRVALGKDYSDGGDFDRRGFKQMLDEYQDLLGGFKLGDYFPSIDFIQTLSGMTASLQHTFKKFDDFFDEVINEHLSSERKPDDIIDLVTVLLDIQKNGSYDQMPLTMANVKAIMLDMFAAGTDTTFITLDWAMTELMMNPEVMQKAQAEVRSVVGDRQVVAESDIPHLPYMKAIIKEIFRFHPPVPVLVPRESMEAVVIDGYNIPEKTRIYVNYWAIGRDPDLWENPDKFDPDRFMGKLSHIDFKGMDFELIPFGAGRRSCPAIAFGTATVEIALAQLLHSFDYELPPGVKAEDIDNTEAFGISMHRTVPLHVIAKPHFR